MKSACLFGELRCNEMFVTEMKFFVVADGEVNHSEGMTGLDEALHGGQGFVRGRTLMPILLSVTVACEPEVLAAHVAGVRQVGGVFAHEARALGQCAEE